MRKPNQVQVGDIADLNHVTISKKIAPTKIRYLDISSVQEGFIAAPPIPLFFSSAPSRARRVVRKGDTLLSTVRPGRRSIVHLKAPGEDWIASTGFCVLSPKTHLVHPRFLYYSIFDPAFTKYLVSREKGAAYPAVSQADIAEGIVFLLPIREQQAIASILGALDDKIESNRRRRVLCRQLGLVIVEELTDLAPRVPLVYYASSISRGVTPKYYKDQDTMPICVLNQRCIRDGWVSLNSARLMLPRRREKKPAIAEFDDLLVNSTGQGTLGRVGRWSYREPVYVDSHVTVVKSDRQRISPVLLPYLVFSLQSEIEQMAEGSTGQTELSPSNLGSLQVPLLTLEEQKTVVEQLSTLEEMAHHCSIETKILAELRDTLLPELMSGRMRVDEAGRLVAGVLGEEPMEDAQSH